MAVIMASQSRQPGIGVGTWAWGNQFLWGYSPERDDERLAATFQRCLQQGLLFFDTADSYGTGRFNGRSETLLGQFAAAASAADQARICIATKLAPFPWRLGRQGYRRAFAASQERLQGQLQRVQLHWSTARYAPWQEAPLLDGLADQGVALSSLQVQLSLLAPQPIQGNGVAAVCRELGIELIAYSPLALGLLSRSDGQVQQPIAGPRGALFRRFGPRIQPLRQAMAELAEGRPGGLAAVALNWCRAHGAMPIPGLRSPEQVDQTAAALSWMLSTAERDRLDALVLAGDAARMPANPFQSA